MPNVTTGTAGPSAAAAAQAANAASLNQAFNNYLFIIVGSLVVITAAWRLANGSASYIRQLVCLNNNEQFYFTRPSPTWASFKRNLLIAPVWGQRHNREFQLSTAVNMGTLPTRLELLLLLAYLGTNISFCVTSIDWNQPLSLVLQDLRNRSGILAVVNMIPLFVLAARNSPLITALGFSFDTFNLFHRWLGRIVVFEIVVHTACWTASQVTRTGWASVQDSIRTKPLIMFGLIATVSMIAMAFQAMSILRHAFYEAFKLLHILLAILSIVGLWYHLRLADVPQFKILIGVVVIWGLERLLRIIRIIYRNNWGSKAIVECLPGNAVRVTLDLARPWDFKPGQHAYLYMPSIGLWTSHPFSVAWSEEVDDAGGNKELPTSRQDILGPRKTRLSFIIRSRTGFTNTLFKKAEAATGGKLLTRCLAEGPYGGLHRLHSYGTVMLFAGGIGITHQVPYVRDLVAGYANGTVAARKIVLIWVIQNPEHLEWIRPWMAEILAMERRREVLRIMLFVSRPRSTKEIQSPSATVQMFPGRPSIETLMDLEIESQVGAMGVSVCGSGSLSDDVRKAVRNRQHVANIDYFEEAFSW